MAEDAEAHVGSRSGDGSASEQAQRRARALLRADVVLSQRPRLRAVVLAGIILAAVLAGLVAILLGDDLPDELRIATATEGGLYWSAAEGYAPHLAAHGVEVVPVATNGSRQNLDMLLAGEVDAAVVQGGVANATDDARLRSLCTIWYEALWIVHVQGENISRLEDLQGEVAIGREGSGTLALTKQVIAAYGDGLPNLTVNETAGINAASRDRMTNGSQAAGMVVTNAEQMATLQIWEVPGLRLMPDPGAALALQFDFFELIELPEGTLDLSAGRPARDVELLTTPTMLAVRADFPEALIPLLIDAAREVHEAGGLLEKPFQFPSPHGVDIPIHRVARDHLLNGETLAQQLLPFWLATNIDRYGVIVFTVLAVVVSSWGYFGPFMQWRDTRRTSAEMARWFAVMREIEDDIHTEQDLLMHCEAYLRLRALGTLFAVRARELHELTLLTSLLVALQQAWAYLEEELGSEIIDVLNEVLDESPVDIDIEWGTSTRVLATEALESVEVATDLRLPADIAERLAAVLVGSQHVTEPHMQDLLRDTPVAAAMDTLGSAA